MPVVPRPQTMSTMPSVSSGGGFGNPLSLDAATLPGRQISALGEAIQSGAHAAEVLARSEKDKAEATVALDGSNRLQQKRFDLADPDKVFPGVNDWSKTDQALAEFDKGWADISSNMSPGARGMLDQSAMATRNDLVRDLARNDADRARKFHADVLATTVNQATGVLMAGAGGDDAGYAARARAALTTDGLGQGLSGEDLDIHTASAFGRRVVEPVVTARLSQGDVTSARAFFDAHRDGMAADDADILDKHLIDAGQAWDAKTAVDGLWMRLGPKGLNDPIDIEAMENDLVVRHDGDDKALMRERDEVLHRILGHVEARDETNAGNANAAIKLVKDGASPSQVASLPQFLALPKDQQQQLIDWQRGLVMEKLTGFAPDQNLDRMAQQFAAYHDLTGTDALKQMSEARIQALEPVLGEDLTRQALAEKQTPTPIDDTDFRTVVSSLGLNANPGPRDVIGKARIGLLRSRIDMAIAAAQVDGRMLTPQQRRDIAFGQGHNVVEGHPFFNIPQTTQAMLAVTPEAMRTPRPASSANAGRGLTSSKPWESPDGFQTALGFAGVRLAPESVYPPLSPPAWTPPAKEVKPASRLRYDPNWMTKALEAPPVHTSEDDRNRPSPAYSLKDGPPPKPVVDDKGFTLFSTQTIGPSEGFRPGVTVDSGQDVIRLTISNGKRGWVSGKTMDARKSVYDPSEPGSFGNPIKLRDAGIGTAAGYFAAGMQDTFGSRIMYQVKRIPENADGTLRWRFFPDKRDIVQQGDLQAKFGGKPRTIEIPLTRPKPGEHFHYAVMLSGYDETAPGTSVQVWTKTNSEPRKKP